jgi:hypothetical protein
MRKGWLEEDGWRKLGCSMFMAVDFLWCVREGG